MKKLSVIIFIIAITTSIHAQFALKVTPFTLTRNMMFTVHGETALPGTENVSICLGLSPNLFPKSLGLANDSINGYYYNADFSQSWKGFSIDPEVRYYGRKMMEGMYVGLYGSFRFSSAKILEYHDKDTTSTYFNPTGGSQKLNTLVSVYGVTVGYQKVYGKNDGFLLDVYGGYGKKITTRTFEPGEQLHTAGFTKQTDVGNALRLNVSLGYFFGRKEQPTMAP